MLTSLNVNDLVRVFGRAVFERGLQYAQQGAVFSLRQEGHVIRGQVMGSQLYHTHLQVVPPYECRCTCPYDGPCKHAVALAISWLRQEELGGTQVPAPVGSESIRERLERLSAGELVSLLVELVDTVSGAHAAVLGLLIQREAEAMGRVPGRASEEALAVRSLLRSLLAGAPAVSDENDDWEEGWDDEGEGDWEHSLGIDTGQDDVLLALDGQIDALISSVGASNLPESLPFRVLAMAGCSVELVEAGERLGSDSSRWSGQIERMMNRVASLVAEPCCPDEIAQTALSELLECYARSVSGLGSLLKPGLVGATSNPDLREWFLGLVAERSHTAAGPARMRLYDLAGEVQAHGGDLRAALESLRRAGASAEALLELARKCERAGDREATVEAVHMAVSAVTSWNAPDLRIRAAKVLIAAADRPGALALLLENFRQSPSLGAARSLLETAEGDAERPAMAAELIDLVGQSGDLALRVRLNLEAGKPRSALWALEEMREYRPDLHVEVAAGIAKSDIDTAVELWTKAIHFIIGRKNRSAYAEAAQALVAMRTALGHAQQWARWQRYYWDLQDQYRPYRALKDELAQAGL